MHQSYLGARGTNYESINGIGTVGGWADPDRLMTATAASGKRKSAPRPIIPGSNACSMSPGSSTNMVMMDVRARKMNTDASARTSRAAAQFYLNDADGWFCGPYYCAAGDRTARETPGRMNGDGPGSLFSMLFSQGHPDYRTLLADRITKRCSIMAR